MDKKRTSGFGKKRTSPDTDKREMRSTRPERAGRSFRDEKPERPAKNDRFNRSDKPSKSQRSLSLRYRNEDGFDAVNKDKPQRKHYAVDYNEGLILEGRNAVLEALNHDKAIDKIYMRKGPVEGSITVIAAKAREKGIVLAEVAKEKLDYMSQSGNHQGVIAICPAHEYVEVEDILDIASKKGEPPFIIILDSITDPHNLGAIMRSAECCGAHGIIIPKRRSVTLTGIVSKTSAGAIEHVSVARVTNLNTVIDTLKEKGIWVCCGMPHGRPLFKADLKGPLAVVIGGEGEGVSKLIEKKSDFSVQIPMYGKIGSLNASVAASVIMYEVIRQRKFL